MASKNTPGDLLNSGFSPEQFGKAAATWFAYAQALLDEQSLLVLDRVGTLHYVLSDTDAKGLQVKLSERYMACAILCSRRINRLESALAQSRQSDQMTNLIAELRNNQRNYTRMAEGMLATLDATPRGEATLSAPAFGAVRSSHFAAVLQ